MTVNFTERKNYIGPCPDCNSPVYEYEGQYRCSWQGCRADLSCFEEEDNPTGSEASQQTIKTSRQITIETLQSIVDKANCLMNGLGRLRRLRGLGSD